VFSKDSLDITDEDRREICRRVRDAEERRVLITHGTDTMVQTGKALGEITDKTVVLVGSLSPSRFKGSDAEFNVGFAFAAVQLLPPGVFVTMNGRVFGVNEVRKNVEQNRFEFDGS
jgi:L-asparaginase